jgi:hypothetical protein
VKKLTLASVVFPFTTDTEMLAKWNRSKQYSASLSKSAVRNLFGSLDSDRSGSSGCWLKTEPKTEEMRIARMESGQFITAMATSKASF